MSKDEEREYFIGLLIKENANLKTEIERYKDRISYDFFCKQIDERNTTIDKLQEKIRMLRGELKEAYERLELYEFYDHGDLIDRDELRADCHEQKIHDDKGCHNEYCGVTLKQIEKAKVIIPAVRNADTEGKVHE